MAKSVTVKGAGMTRWEISARTCMLSKWAMQLAFIAAVLAVAVGASRHVLVAGDCAAIRNSIGPCVTGLCPTGFECVVGCCMVA